jgi:hypothetical protein
MKTIQNYHDAILRYKKDRQQILYHPAMVTDEGIRLMITVIDLLEASMRRFINYELPDCMAREEMKTLLDGPRVPGPEQDTEIVIQESVYLENAKDEAAKLLIRMKYLTSPAGLDYEGIDAWLSKYYLNTSSEAAHITNGEECWCEPERIKP